MSICDHEEADTRLIVHVQDAVKNGSRTSFFRTVDTDVIVILVGKLYFLKTLCADINIWVAFGAGKHFMYYHINYICHMLGKDKCLAQLFHSFTGSDTTSAFFGRGKKMAWAAWNCYPDVTEAFTYMALNPYAQLSVDAQHFRQLEHFTVILYDKTSHLENVDEARKELFCQNNKTMQTIPPTQNAVLQHSKRAAYQAALSTTSDLSEQHAEGWGWELDSGSLSYIPVWNTLPVASKTGQMWMQKCAWL